MVLFAGCATNESSCITNRDCESGICINGTCATPEGDSGPEACVPWTCESLGQVCRDADDGCGGRVSCGTPGTTTHGPLEWGASPYVRWDFPQRPSRAVTHTLCFDEVPSVANGFGRGMYFQLFNGSVGQDTMQFGFRDSVFELGEEPGILYSKYDDFDATHVRLGPNSIMPEINESVTAGIRMPFAFSVGCYETRVEIADSSAGGDWVDLTISRGGTDFYVGGLWFAREETSTPGLFSQGGTTWAEFFRYAEFDSSEMPRYDFRVRALGDGVDASAINVRYHRLAAPNTSCEFLPASQEVRFLLGGDSFRCVPGSLEGDLYELDWVVPNSR